MWFRGSRGSLWSPSARCAKTGSRSCADRALHRPANCTVAAFAYDMQGLAANSFKKASQCSTLLLLVIEN